MEKNEKIERILEAGKTVNAVDPNPYLFNKVLFKLKDKAEETYRTRPALVWASMSVLVLFITINSYMMLSGNTTNTGNEMKTLVDSYGLNDAGGLNYE